MAQYKTPVLIIGSGPAGYTAGIYAARAGLKPLIVSGGQIGGQLTLTTDVENYPGFPEPINGGELMELMKQQALNLGVEFVEDKIIEVDFKQHPFSCNSENYNLFTADAIIIATGASARWLGLESEQKYLGFGVSGCATCDGFFYRGKDVAVVGGGNTAAEEALYLTNFAKSVTLIHRREDFRADPILVEEVLRASNISVLRSTVVEALEGQECLTGLRLRHTGTGEVSHLAVSALFEAVGQLPETSAAAPLLALDQAGFIPAGEDCRTPLPGIFAAGDCRAKSVRQLTTACSDGAVAALAACDYCRLN